MSNDEEISRQLAILYRFRKDIITDLDVQDVLPELLSQLVIDHRDKQLIDHEGSLEDKAEKLLHILEAKAVNETQSNANAIPIFINTLKSKYDWIYKRLSEDVPDSHVVPILPSSSSSSPSLRIRNKLLDKLVHEESSFEINKDEKTKILLEAGGVQCLPANAIERKDLLFEITDALKMLKNNNYLVLQGMAGSGKSVLATQAVSDYDLVNSVFPSGVFWLPIGKECSESKDALLAKMRILCEKLGESRAPNSFDHGADILRTAFMKRTNTLLILDDVWRTEVIRAFDVGCRILVTTRDLSVMDVVNGRYTHIFVKEGFTQEESLNLFSQALKIPHHDLPNEAKLIHVECKGSPMVISLISSLLQDHQVTKDMGRWKYYLESLTKRKYSKMKKNRKYEHASILDAISLSFEALSITNQELYSDFALFQDDVGIPSSVLTTIWSMQKYEVEDVMKTFVRKSLVIEEYDPQNKCYVYSIHDLLLDYLKTKLISPHGDLETARHKRLVDKYLDICGGEFHKLPDDGYIYFYLGYHLYKSKMSNYFQKIYFDLQFIGEKLRITGPADLLVDIRKYLDFIVGSDEERLSNIEEIQTFAQLVGHRIYGQLYVDIIQIALQTPHLKWIHGQAKQLAGLTGNRLYLEWRNAGQWKHPESTVLCSDHIRCVKFIGSRGGSFIAGLSSGVIQLCDLESSAVCHAFFGHSDAITSLNIFPSGGKSKDFKVVSSSEDTTCKLWDMKSILDEVESKPYELKTGRMLGVSPSPKLRPDYWAFDNERDDSYLTFGFHTGPVSNAGFSSNGSLIVSTSVNEIMIWSSSNAQILTKLCPVFETFSDLTFQQCLFPLDLSPAYLLCSAENQVILLSSERSSLYKILEAHQSRIVELLFLSEREFCSVSENEIGLWTIKKIYSKNKTWRSRSLSPSRCVQIQLSLMETETDSKIIRSSTTKSKIKTLDPNWAVGNSNGHGNGLSPDANSILEESFLKPSKSANMSQGGGLRDGVAIDNGNIAIQISKEEVLGNRSNGILLCAAITCSEDRRGRILACGTSDHKILLWRLDQRQYLGSFTSHSGWVTCMDFSCVDVCTILSGSEDRTVMVWDIQEEEKGTKEPQKNAFFSSTHIPYSLDQGYFLSIFSTEKNTIQIYRDSKRLYESQAFNKGVSSVAMSECGKYAAVGLVDGKVHSISTSEENLLRNKDPPLEPKYMGSLQSSVNCLKFGCGGKYLVVGTKDGSFMIFEGTTILHKILLSQNRYLCTHFFGEFVVAVAQDSSTIVLNPRKKEEMKVWKAQFDDIQVTSCEFCVEERYLALGTGSNGVFILKFFEDNHEIVEKNLSAKTSSPVRSLAFNANASKLAIGYDNGLISIWNLIVEALPQKEMELVLHKSWVRHLKFSRDTVSNWLISCGDNLAVWTLDKHEVKSRRTSFMSERRRRRSGESPARNPNRLSLELPIGNKIGRQGKRELLQQFSFRGNYAQHFVTDPSFNKILTVDDTGIFYMLETLKNEQRNPNSAKI